MRSAQFGAHPLGLDIADRVPRAITPEEQATADIVVLMKSGLDLPAAPVGRVLEWSFPNPDKWDVESVRPLRAVIQAYIVSVDAR